MDKTFTYAALLDIAVKLHRFVSTAVYVFCIVVKVVPKHARTAYTLGSNNRMSRKETAYIV